MIKIKLLECDKHRNETTFRYFIENKELFKESGIEFLDETNWWNSDSYDLTFVGQASIIDKKKSLKESVEAGKKFVSEISGDYIIVDGQDSTSLIGTIDVFRESNALMFLKSCYLNDFDLYKKGWVNGRMYWGDGDYAVPDIDKLKSGMRLSGCNWGNTLNPTGKFNFLQYGPAKKYDVCGMFQYPLTEEVFEHDLLQTPHYNKCRKAVYDFINTTNHSACKLIDGKRVPEQEYVQNMYDSKIIFSPYGFGAYGAPRDIQAAQFGSVLIKPDMSWVDTTPNMYVDGETYIACKHDFSDLAEKVDYVLSDFENIQKKLVENFRSKITDVYNPIHLVKHIHNILDELKGEENLIIKKSEVRDINLGHCVDIVNRADHKKNIIGEAGIHHYKLLAYLSSKVSGTIVELGTHHGTGALAICYKPNNRVVSYDINKFFGLNKKPENLELRYGDIMETDDDGLELLLKSEYIFLDTNHDGIFENKVFNYLKENNYKGLLVLDDIHWAPEMIEFWNNIDITKYDVTDIGHGDPTDTRGPSGNIPGTGIVDFSGNLIIEE